MYYMEIIASLLLTFAGALLAISPLFINKLTNSQKLIFFIPIGLILCIFGTFNTINTIKDSTAMMNRINAIVSRSYQLQSGINWNTFQPSFEFNYLGTKEANLKQANTELVLMVVPANFYSSLIPKHKLSRMLQNATLKKLWGIKYEILNNKDSEMLFYLYNHIDPFTRKRGGGITYAFMRKNHILSVEYYSNKVSQNNFIPSGKITFTKKTLPFGYIDYHALSELNNSIIIVYISTSSQYPIIFNSVTLPFNTKLGNFIIGGSFPHKMPLKSERFRVMAFYIPPHTFSAQLTNN